MNFVDRIAGLDHPYVIAEIGINHNGDMSLARRMVDAAKAAGADCAKFQNFMADKYISRHAGKAGYQSKDGTVAGKSQNEIIKACELTYENTLEMKAYCAQVGIDFMSTPFEVWSLRRLVEIGVPAIKVSSCNLANIPFLEELAETKLPVLLSTGMGTMDEVIRAVGIFKRAGVPLMLFQCTSNYPSRIENANLRVLETYRQLFEVPVGFSDHTPGNTAAITAIALGAVAVEKHFTLSRDLVGIDQKASIEPHELALLVTQLREAKAALGSPLKIRTDEEADTFTALRRSLHAIRPLEAGEVLTADMVAIKRPGDGLPPEFLDRLVGRRLRRQVAEDSKISLDDFIDS